MRKQVASRFWSSSRHNATTFAGTPTLIIPKHFASTTIEPFQLTYTPQLTQPKKRDTFNLSFPVTTTPLTKPTPVLNYRTPEPLYRTQQVHHPRQIRQPIRIKSDGDYLSFKRKYSSYKAPTQTNPRAIPLNFNNEIVSLDTLPDKEPYKLSGRFQLNFFLSLFMNCFNSFIR